MNASPPRAEVVALGGATMGTSWSVKAAVAGRADLHALHARVQQALDRVVRQMSTWERDSDISRFNRGPAGQWFDLPAEFHAVLRCALDIARQSDGAFDPTLGPLVGLWGFGAGAGPRAVPGDDVLAAAHHRAGWRRLLLQDAPPRALQAGGIGLDLSAIAKGYAVDLVAGRLREDGIGAALVEVGGELYGYGRKPDGTPWLVVVEGVPDLDEDAGDPRIVELDGMAVATSGDRWHHYEVEGKRYSHTLDPRSGRPVTQVAASVTVLDAQAMRADAWATALTVMGCGQGLAFANAHGLAARFVTRGAAGFEEHMTDAFKARLLA